MKERHLKMKDGTLIYLDDLDFQSASKHSWHINNGYATTYVSGKRIHLHVFLLGKAPPGFHIDHINRNKLDNRRENLRVITAAENIRNRRTYQGINNPFFGKKHSNDLKEKISKRHSIPVDQFSLDGKFIRRWNNALCAQKEINISNGNINQVLKGKRKSAGGYKWSQSCQ